MKQSDFATIRKTLPENPGIYLFKKGKEILYVGKASSLKSRVGSYFARDLMRTRGPLLVKMLEEADGLDWKTTPSVLEALILEAYEIKSRQPVYNSKEKDNKSYNYVIITDEIFPRVMTVRGRELVAGVHGPKPRAIFGPFPHGNQLREALKIIRKIFPFRDRCTPKEGLVNPLKAKPCFNRQIGLCPGVCTGEVSSKEYGKIIRNLELFFAGKTAMVRKNLEKQMNREAKERAFEKAQLTKRTLFALDHIRDVGLIKEDHIRQEVSTREPYRIEAYDIAHLSGSGTVGVMVVVEDGELAKNAYRKFRIRGVGGKVTVDDTKNLGEVLIRRLGHAEWSLPNLIVIDGGVAQRNVAERVLRERGFSIDIASVVKDEKHKPREILGEQKTISLHGKSILLANHEAHRFAINYHKLLRNKTIRGKG
jgi:excinuclease ABC subunit C